MFDKTAVLSSRGNADSQISVKLTIVIDTDITEEQDPTVPCLSNRGVGSYGNRSFSKTIYTDFIKNQILCK